MSSGDEFVSADVFLQQLDAQPTAPEPADARHKRESVAVLAQSNTVRDRLALWKQQTGSARTDNAAPMPGRQPPTFRPGAGRSKAAAAVPRLGPIAEHGGSAVVDSALRPRQAPVAPAGKSPSTKSHLAQKKEAHRFHSVVFTAPKPSRSSLSSGGAPRPGRSSLDSIGSVGQPSAPSRVPLAGAVAVLPAIPAAGMPSLRPVVASAPAGPPPAAAVPVPDVATVPVPHAAPMQPQLQPVSSALSIPATVVAEESEQFDDARSAPSVEGSGAWHDAQEPQLVLQQDEGAASEAETVLPGQPQAPIAAAAVAHVATRSTSWVPLPIPSHSPPADGDEEVSSRRPAAGAAGASLASELFQSATSQLPALDASFAAASPVSSQGAASFGAAPVVASPPAVVVDTAAAEQPALRLSLPSSGSEAPVPADPMPSATVPGMELRQQAVTPDDPQQSPSAFPALATQAEMAPVVSEIASAAALAPPPAPVPESSRHSVVSVGSERSLSTAGAPSLACEYSERSLRYSVDNLRPLASPQLSAEGILEPEALALAVEQAQAAPVAATAALPPAAAASTPPQVRRPAAPAGMPTAPTNTPTGLDGQSGARHSLAPEAAAVAQAIAAAAAGAQGKQAASEPASPAAGMTAAARLAAVTVMAASSPAPPSPAMTEYDGEDVVMQDAEFTPAPSSMRRVPAGSGLRFKQPAAPGSTRFKLEAIASAGHTLVHTPPAQAPPTSNESDVQASVTGVPSEVAAAAPVSEQASPAVEPLGSAVPQTEPASCRSKPASSPLDLGAPANSAAEFSPVTAQLEQPASPLSVEEQAPHAPLPETPAGEPESQAPPAMSGPQVAADVPAQAEAAAVPVPQQQEVWRRPIEEAPVQLEQPEQQSEQQPEEAAPAMPALVMPEAPDPSADEDALAVFAAKLWPSISPSAAALATSPAAAPAQEDQVALAFAARPKLAMSPAASSGAAAVRTPAEPEHVAEPAVAAEDQAAEQEPGQQPQPEAAPSPACASPGAAAPEPTTPTVVTTQQVVAQPQPQQQHVPSASMTMCVNPLADTPGNPCRASYGASPALSGTAVSGTLSNPVYAGTPGAPTPPSVTLKSFPASRLSRGASAAGTPAVSGVSSASAGTPASTGIKLAERLQEVAAALQQPASSQGLAAALGSAAPSPGVLAGGQTPGNRFEYAEDVQRLMAALEARTPGTALLHGGGRGTGRASTVRRSQQPGLVAAAARSGRLSLSSGGNSMLDLSGFDCDGNRQTAATPLLHHAMPTGTGAASTPTGPLLAGARSASAPASSAAAVAATAVPAATPAELCALREEAAALRTQVASLSEEKEEVVAMLAHYQGSIAELQDKHSEAMVKLRAETELARAQVDKEVAARAEVDRQFSSLYQHKYLPLKQQVAALQQELAAVQKQASQAEAQAAAAAQEAEAAREREAAEREAAAGARAGEREARAALAAAREAEARAREQMAAEGRRAEKAAAARLAELEDVKARLAGLTRQYDEAVHRANVARQARERAAGEAQRKEEEACALEVRLREMEGVLKDYKRENSKFFEVKERYKATIAGLEKEVAAKEGEKQTLLQMCNELMNRLEREGLAL